MSAGQDYLALKARCEMAEKERDEARAAHEERLRLWGYERKRAERAEADNAALLEAYRRTWGCVQHDNVLHSPACNMSDDALGLCAPECPALYVVSLLKADHPGAALLAEVEALRKAMQAFRDVEWERADWQGFCPFRRHPDVRCNATDGHVSAAGTPRPRPHDERCPYHTLAAVAALKERKT